MKVTPVPIPNTTVKLHRADGTAGEALWESRTLPGNKIKSSDTKVSELFILKIQTISIERTNG